MQVHHKADIELTKSSCKSGLTHMIYVGRSKTEEIILEIISSVLQSAP